MRKVVKRTYVPGQHAEKIGMGIAYKGGFLKSIGNAFKKATKAVGRVARKATRAVGRTARNVGRTVAKVATSQPFKSAVRFARKNIITPLARKGAEFAADNLGKVIGMIPGVGMPASIAYDNFAKKHVKGLADKGVSALDNLAEKKGYGIAPHGSGMGAHGSGMAPHGVRGKGIAPHGAGSSIDMTKKQAKKRNQAVNSLVDSMMNM